MHVNITSIEMLFLITAVIAVAWIFKRWRLFKAHKHLVENADALMVQAASTAVSGAPSTAWWTRASVT